MKGAWVLLIILRAADARSVWDAPAWAPVGGMSRTNDAAVHKAQYESKYVAPPPPGTCAASTVLPAPPPPARDGPLEIFVLPHSHDDVGWIETVFGYFNGSVTHILSSVTQALAADPRRRFIWSETKWFELWWPQQNASTQAQFRANVRSGQFEFVGAGWSQSDEVSPSYRDIVDNTVVGHEFLRRTLGGDCPTPGRCVRFGWQIDMFSGYSATTPSLWAMMGYVRALLAIY